MFRSLRLRRRALLMGLIFTALLAAVMVPTTASAEEVSSRFDEGDEEWRASGDAAGPPVFRSDGGNPGGYVSVTDGQTGGVVRWVAPARFLGDQREKFGGVLSFDLTQSTTTSPFSSEDIILEGAGKRLTFSGLRPPGRGWTPYSVALVPGAGWKLSGTSRAPTWEEMRAVMGSLTGLSIRAEYSAERDTDGLDNVVLAPPATGPPVSRFEEGGEGWIVAGDPEEPPSFRSSGGNPAGYLEVVDGYRGQSMYWTAPWKFLDDQQASYGGRLSFDLKQSTPANQYLAEDVILRGEGLDLTLSGLQPPGTDWTSYSVPLRPGEGWRVRGTSRIPTEEEFRAVLRTLTGLLIRAEYSSDKDTDGLDNVELSDTPVEASPPRIDVRSPIDGATVGRGDELVADYDCHDEDGGSGVAACEGTVGDGERIDTDQLGRHSFTVVARDHAGNEATQTVYYEVVDRSPPQIEIRVPADGATVARGEDLHADYLCRDEDGGSGIADCKGTVGIGERVETGRLGRHAFTVVARDAAGNEATQTVHYEVVDRSPPEVRLSTPADGASYTLGRSVFADFSCADEEGGSGLASCIGDVTNGQAIDTATIGQKDFTVRASDSAGNRATKTHSYSVVYDFAGFFEPVEDPPAVNAVRAGQAVPLKFSLGGDQGLDVLAEGYPVSKQIDCATSAEIQDVQETMTADASRLTYDAAADQYVYVWKTDRSWAGTCRQLEVKLTDGTSHRVKFALR